MLSWFVGLFKDFIVVIHQTFMFCWNLLSGLSRCWLNGFHSSWLGLPSSHSNFSHFMSLGLFEDMFIIVDS